ncbi:type VI secretion system Vgr family protein [Burkholderia vietnamiensis]|uniref:type VI secretion system Vgr family protein n=1 Tax=Burkholderia vietnamiensis TaxID=60552 RepID=UPI0015933D04|nr:type VI secretion system Vgr family protein [Burkholderia vietnamiensis]MDN7665637.1 type VI secretion system Vgr family protein [Burkholderia vietnamiensis]
MARLLDDARHFLPGRQAYFFDVPGTGSAAALSVVSFDATEAMGAPTEARIVMTHPLPLARIDYLNRDATFSIQPDDGVPRTFSGFIARFSTLQTTADFTKYEVVLKSHFARLAAVTTSRIYQHQTTPQIIEAVLRSHGLEGHQFAFRLRRAYPQHLFRFQYKTDDLSYVQMLMQKAGIYSAIVETEHGDQVVFGDDIDHYQWDPHLTVPYRETAGLDASGVEAVATLKTHTVTVPQSFIVADYNPEQAWERFRDEANVAPQDSTTYGKPYVYGTHHLDQAGAQWEAQLHHEAAIAWQVVYDGESNVLALQPGRVLDLDTELPDAPDGQVVIAVTHTGARNRAYTNTYQAIPANRRFRFKLDEAKWQKIAGTLSARVTSPDKYKYAYLNAAGQYRVRFDVDFADWPSGGESVPLRLAKPFAGKLQTGFHFPALDNDEAVVAFRDGDPDKPEIIAFHHHSQARDLVTSDRRWLSRNMIRTQSNNKLRMEDWAGQEGIKLSTEQSGTTHLDLGYLMDEKLERRGEGFELRTSGHGVGRAGKGLHLTAYDRPGAAGQQLDMQETIAQLESAIALAKSLADATRTAKAIPADIDAQQAMKDDFDGLQQPGILASAPASVGIVAGGGVQIAAQDAIAAMAGKNADFSVLGRFTAAAGERISLFAQKLGIKIFAGKGPVEVQAQSDAMSLTAAKDVTVSSVNGKVRISAKAELVLNCGGAFIQLKDGNITLGGPLDLFLKVITIQKQGPAEMHGATPWSVLPQPTICLECLIHAASVGATTMVRT